MKRIILFVAFISILFLSIGLLTAGLGDKCTGDASCGFNQECNDGVCIKKKQFDYGSSGKTGNPCSIDADCIGSGKCVDNGYGSKYCSGN